MRRYRVSNLEGVASGSTHDQSAEQVTLDAIRMARERIDAHIHRTGVDESVFLTRTLGGDRFTRDKKVWLKTENLQKTGSFKIRGALNKLSLLPEAERSRGVVAASAGNHAQGVAHAAHLLGCRSLIVMPRDAPKAKINATKGYQGYDEGVKLEGKDFTEAYQYARSLAGGAGPVFIEPFNDVAVIAGQGTIGLEIADDFAVKGQDPDIILVPVGGGGLIAGIATAIKEGKPKSKTQIFGIQAEGCAAALEALESKVRIELKQAHTIADGIKVRQVGEIPFAVMEKYIDEIIAVKERDIVKAMFLLQERGKLVVEGAGAVGVAALLDPEYADLFVDKNILVVLSGGNVDMDKVGDMLETALIEEGRTAVLQLKMLNTPDAFSCLYQTLEAQKVNLRHISQTHILRQWPGHEIEVVLTLETEDKEKIDATIAALRANLKDQCDFVEPITKPFVL